jgi:hypothetical protein
MGMMCDNTNNGIFNMNRLCRHMGSVLALMTLASSAVSAGPRTNVEFARIAEWSLQTQRGREQLPPHLSMSPEANMAIGAALRDIIRHGAQQARAGSIHVVNDEDLMKSPAGGERPYEERLVLRLHQDSGGYGYFIVGSEMDHDDGLSTAAWFFYKHFFVAYAGLHNDFRKADSPLARGVAALAAFNISYRGNLSLLPDFKPEAAVALLLLNADPELVTHLREKPPTHPDLRIRVAVALGHAGFDKPEEQATVLLGDPRSNLPVRPFILTAFVGEDPAARDAMWRSALETVPYPGLLAEIGIAAWLRRPMDPKAVGELDKVFTERMLNVLEREFGMRGITHGDVTKKAIFDVSQLTSVFGFVWTYRPEFEAWRKDVNAGASIRDVYARNTQRNALKQRLAGLLAEKANPAEQLCALFATHPLESGGRQPDIYLDYVAARRPRKMEESPYIEAARVIMTWQMYRDVRLSGDVERIVFVGAVPHSARPRRLHSSPYPWRVILPAIPWRVILPVMETINYRMGDDRLIFADDECARFAEAFQRVQEEYAQTRWGTVRDRERLRRFLKLYYAPAYGDAGAIEKLVSMYAEAAGAGLPPDWTDRAFQEYLGKRVALVAHGNPADLSAWSFYYVFLMTLAYETANDAWGDALMQDFLCVTMTLVLGRTTEQKDRDRNYDDPRWRLAEALHWTRDVIAIMRDGDNEIRAWVHPVGWEHLLKHSLPVLVTAAGSDELYRDGKIEIGNLWARLRMARNAPDLRHVASAMDPELAAVMVVDERKFWHAYSIIAPTEDPRDAFSLSAYYGEGPYANRKGIRDVLGIRATILDF